MSIPSSDLYPPLPNTEAYGQSTAEFAVLPGSIAYRNWLRLLRDGKISYGEFIDWTTPGRFPTPKERLRDMLATVIAGFGGMTWRRWNK